MFFLKKLVLKGVLLLAAIAVVLMVVIMNSQHISTFDIETTTWEYHTIPEAAGWSAEKLNKAKAYYETLDSTAVIAIYDGKILFEWGDVVKNTNAHSVRKSFLSALYGIYHDKGVLELNETLGELKINELKPLNEVEQQATVEDLLTSRSGVFLQSGEESWRMRRARPLRGNFAPGTFFYYNNWDFNALGTIFNKKTEKDLFKVFNDKIAEPLGMEHFSLEQTDYKYEPRRTIHPSYLFKMSARDMARFGQLYLQNGSWNDQRLIPEDWIKQSTSVQAQVPGNDVYGFGFMWWVADAGPFADQELISAVGRYGQSIDIVKSDDLVFVHRVDSEKRRFLPFTQKSVTQKERLRLLRLVLDAKK